MRWQPSCSSIGCQQALICSSPRTMPSLTSRHQVYVLVSGEALRAGRFPRIDAVLPLFRGLYGSAPVYDRPPTRTVHVGTPPGGQGICLSCFRLFGSFSEGCAVVSSWPRLINR